MQKPNLKILDFDKYSKILESPNWHFVLNKFLKEFFYDPHEAQVQTSGLFRETRQEFIELVHYLRMNGFLWLDKFEEFVHDKDRKLIDTIVIHHSGWEPEISIDKMDTFQMVNIYSKLFSLPEKEWYKQPFNSGHLFEGRQTFLAYHYIVFSNGKVINFLKDKYVGRHAGIPEYNARSIAICFHDRLYDKRPTQEAIKTAREIIAKYGDVRILGHKEIQTDRACPGDLFLGETGWKKDLLI